MTAPRDTTNEPEVAVGLLSDALVHLLALDPARRRAGLAGVVGRMFGADPVRLTHPAVVPDGFDVVHFAKSGAGLAPRPFAATVTVGLADRHGHELIAWTLADARTPDGDRVGRMLAHLGQAGAVADRVVGLPEGCLGRSSHAAAVLVDADGDPRAPFARAVPEVERVLGAPLVLVVPVTPREQAWIEANGAARYLAAAYDQGVAPTADRPAGEIRLP